MAKDPTAWKLDQLSNRLAQLLREEKNPQATMRALSRRLFEDGLSQHSPEPDESPQQFAESVIRENPAMWDEVASMSLPNLQAIESAEDLINRLLPSHHDA